MAEGVFLFKTNRGKELVANVKDASKKMSVGLKPNVDNTVANLRKYNVSRQSPPKFPLGV